MDTLLLYYAAINIIAFLLYGIDKLKAKHKAWRIPEKTLLGICFLGGFAGAYLGMKYFRHKTKHEYFRIVIVLSFVLHLALLSWLGLR